MGSITLFFPTLTSKIFQKADLKLYTKSKLRSFGMLFWKFNHVTKIIDIHLHNYINMLSVYMFNADKKKMNFLLKLLKLTVLQFFNL